MNQLGRVLLLVVFMLPCAAMAQTVSERLACKGDFQKLCPGVKPGEGRPFACLAKHKNELSPACLKVIEAHAK